MTEKGRLYIRLDDGKGSFIHSLPVQWHLQQQTELLYELAVMLSVYKRRII